MNVLCQCNMPIYIIAIFQWFGIISEARGRCPSSGYSDWRFIPYGQKLQDENNRKSKGGGWADHIFLIHESVQLPDHASVKKHFGSQGGMPRYLQASLVDSILAKKCLSTHGSDLGWPQPAIAWSRAQVPSQRLG